MPASNDTRPTLQPSTPKYLQIADYFREQIENGKLVPGAEIDSERVIGETFGVSRPTATRAIAQLRQWGLVASRPGLGTFVRDHVATAALNDDGNELATRLAHVEHRLAALPSELAVQLEQVQRAVGVLQAQMIELRDHVGLEWRDPHAAEPKSKRRPA